MIRRNNKIMSVVLAMTIISGLVTPVSATEKIEDSSSNQVFSLENADLEKISDDTDILEEISKTEEADNSDEPVEEIIDDIQVDNEQIINDEESEKSESLPEENTEVQEEVDAPLYDSIDEEMENYLKEYLQSLNSGISDEELEKLLQEYLDKINSEAEAEDNLQLEDGIYSIGNNALKMDDEENSLLREYLSEQSLLEVKDGKISVILTFDKNVTELDEYEILLNDKKIKIKTVESDDSILRIKFNINNLDEDIVLKTNVSNDYFSKDEECRIILDTESLEKLEDDIVDEDNESIQDGTYVIANSILKFDQNKESVLGNYLSSESILEVKSGQKYLTLVFDKDVSVIKEFNIYVNNFISSYKVVESNDDVLKVRFLIESIDDEIVVDANITNEFFSENLKAQIILDSESLQKKSDNVYFEESIIPEINLPEINLDEEILPMVEENANKIQVKKLEDGKYTIGTTMIKEDGSGTSSAGAYFSKESDVTVVNGKYKVTLNITSGMVMMSNLGIKVNGQSINIEEQRNGGTGSVSFEIPNLDYEITMSFTITPPGWKDMNHTIIVGLDKSNIKNEKGEFFEIVKDESVNVLDDGEYIIGTKILKTGTQEESMAKGYFKEKSDLISQNGRYNLTLYANNLSMMSNIVVKVNGKEVDIVIKSNSDGTGTLSFDIPSLNSDIVMYCHVDAGIHVADYDFSIGLDKNNITTLAGEKVEAPIEEENAVLSNNTIYKINNELTLNGGTSGLASYLDDTSIIEVDSDGNIYVTINFTMSGLMNGRTIKLNKNTNVTTYAVVNSTDTNGIRFKISSLSDEIHISNQYGSSLNDGFSLVLLEDTLEKTGTISSGSSGSGSNGNEDDADDDDDIEDGTYVIKNYCYKEKSDTTSDARGYLDTESVLVVDDGDMYVILKFTHGKMMSDTSVKVEGKSAKIKTVKESGNKYYIRFEINSLSDEIMVTSTIDTGVPAIGVIKGVKFRVILRESTLKEDDDAADFDDEEEIEEEETTDEEVKVEEPVQDGIIVIPPSSEITDNNTAIEGSKKSTYKVNNEIVTDSQIGYQAARGAVNKTSFYEIIDDKKYMTLGFSQTDILNNIRISNNAQNIPYTVVSEDKSNHTLNIRFEIPSISTQLTVTANVTAMGRDISFGLKFLESTLQLISTEEYENISNNTESNENSSSSGILSGLSSTMSNLFSGGSSSEGNIEVAEEAAEDLASLAKEYFKKYTISNEVISDSAIGRTMARKYLSETSIIEEIDGQFYATITFSSASSMGDFKIEVNGETVSHTVPLKDMGSDLISLRFPISSVNDDIRTYIFISPMKMTIDFGIKFLEDTMTLIDEGTIGEEENSESSSLAETLSNLNQTSQSNKNQMSTVKVAASTSVMVIVLNQGVAGIGSLFRRFKNKSLLSKITNIE